MCKKLFARGKKEKIQLCKTQAGCIRLEISTQLGKSDLLCRKRKGNEWCRVKWAKAPGSSAGKPGGECICTEDLVLTYFRARQTSAPCCPPSRGKRDRNDTSYSRTLNPS